MYGSRRRDGIYHLYPRPNGEVEFKLTPLPKAGVVSEALRQSALALYLVRNVRLLEFVEQFKAVPAADPAGVVQGEQVIAWFLTALPKAANLSPTDIVIVVDANRSDIYGTVLPANLAAKQHFFGQMRSKLLADARTQGFQVVDLDPVFRAAYARERKSFEFPTDRHWNAYGHAIVTEALRTKLGAGATADR
jgi:hypothetical protein